MSRRLRRFAYTALLFVVGLVAAGWLVDAAVGRHIKHRRGFHLFGQKDLNLIGWDVYDAQQRAHAGGSHVRTIFIGDSVARQLFRPGTEANDSYRFLTSNQAISMAGQYYLLREALDHCPQARDIYIFYFPGSLENDLGPELSHDYYCGYFHRPDEIIETFALKRDFPLLASQIGRFLLPNLIAVNSAWHLAPPAGAAEDSKPAGGAYQQLSTEQDPLMEIASQWAGRPPRWRSEADPAGPPGARLVAPSLVSLHFLPKLRAMCQQRAISLHVLPSPCSDSNIYHDTRHVYDEPILYFDKTLFIDTIHFKAPFIVPARRRVIAEYHLDPVLDRNRKPSKMGK